VIRRLICGVDHVIALMVTGLVRIIAGEENALRTYEQLRRNDSNQERSRDDG